MCPVDYYTMIRSGNHKFDLRIHMVRYAMQHGIKAVARALSCSRNTVRKWLYRFEEEGPKGLVDRSRAPKRIPHKTSLEEEKKVIAQRKRTPGFGAERLKREFGLKPGVCAIKRIIRQNGLARRRKKKYQKKRDLREIKAKYKPLRRLQIDVKYLNDIPNYWTPMKDLGLPEYQYTARDPKCGAVFMAFGDSVCQTYSDRFCKRIVEHLGRHGIPAEEIDIQTDLGSEFGGQSLESTERGFTYMVEEVLGAHHRPIRKPNANANADVETFHALEETEYFDIEHWSSRREFWEKTNTYQNYFNVARPNSYKKWKSPLDILVQEKFPNALSVLLLPPVDLATLNIPQGGHHVPVHPETGTSMEPVSGAGHAPFIRLFQLLSLSLTKIAEENWG